jgi:hypothetical protein
MPPSPADRLAGALTTAVRDGLLPGAALALGVRGRECVRLVVGSA